MLSMVRACVFVPAAVLMSAGSHAIHAAQDDKVQSSAVAFATNPEVLIRYEAGRSAEARRAAEEAGFEILEDYEPGLYLRTRPGPGTRSVAARAVAASSAEAVLRIEPNYIVSIPEPIGPRRPNPAAAASPRSPAAAPSTSAATPDDPRLAELWGMENIRAAIAWETGHESPVVVGVIDTGVDYTHEDLRDNIWVNPNETPGDGVDDDMNGIADDVHGARFDGGVGTGDPMDDNAHGTHCAGTIGAVGDNAVGVAGVNWKVRIMALKFLRANGSGTTDDAIRCIDYAVAQKRNGVDLRVLSNSWGGGGRSTLLEEAIARAEAEEILFVAAAGNSSQDNDRTDNYPSNYPLESIIAVASINVREEMSWFSSFGFETVDLAAPGGTLESEDADDILSTVPGNAYDFFAGTSMATPHVAGAVALAWAHPDHSGKSAAEMKELILDNARSIPSLSGRCVTGATLDLTFLGDGGPPPPETPDDLAYFGREAEQAGAFGLNSSTGSAIYMLGGTVYQSNLTFLGEEVTPDGHLGWVYREDYPFAPFDFLFTKDPIGLAPYHRVYARPAEEIGVPFGWMLDASRGEVLGVTDAGIRSERRRQLEEIRARSAERDADRP
ncbi:S8 family peptidase [Tautonia plasticadhaerens]|uniref:Intracellular serine protease n=1 Tax=Tautonia plasticadhaerens TaxID=2527974 RepID=A0A518H5K8_9BACT|nr:S8 family peptidase [Tautonia plasticadhaerens]QDV36124.1 Intracellular serine protease [Tautonia plasticadhaerens]